VLLLPLVFALFPLRLPLNQRNTLPGAFGSWRRRACLWLSSWIRICGQDDRRCSHRHCRGSHCTLRVWEWRFDCTLS